LRSTTSPEERAIVFVMRTGMDSIPSACQIGAVPRACVSGGGAGASQFTITAASDAASMPSACRIGAVPGACASCGGAASPAMLAASNAAILQRGGKVRVKKEGVGGGEGAELNFNVEKLKVNLTFSPAAVATFAHARSLTTFVPKVEKSTVTFGPRLAGHPCR